MVYFLLYVSSATNLFSRKDLDVILDMSRRNNTALAVSGILLYKDGNLMQLLEGENGQLLICTPRSDRIPATMT